MSSDGSHTTGRSMNTTECSVMAKSWSIVGPGTVISSLCTRFPAASARWYVSSGGNTPEPKKCRSPVTGQRLGWAVIAVASRPSKSKRPTVSSSGVTSVGAVFSTSARIRPPWAMTWVLASVASRSSIPFSPTMRRPASNDSVRTYRLRYQVARPPESSTPWSIPSPKNQWPGSPAVGFGPLRR